MDRRAISGVDRSQTASARRERFPRRSAGERIAECACGRSRHR